MGNAVSPCLQHNSSSKPQSVKLIFWEGSTRMLAGNRPRIAGDIMFECPDKMVMHADSFFLGRPIPLLAVDEELVPGQTYFVLPIDFFSGDTLSSSTIASLCSNPRKLSLVSFGDGSGPFEYVKSEDGKVLIKVVPEFITRMIVAKNSKDDIACGNINAAGSHGFLCSTPELQKHYDQLVGSKVQVWSPKLETISECKARVLPCKLIGLEWKKKKKERK
ncbi:uncharacterized protein LOC115734555 [Rhodamnia argentea]|uniref:Uncharacterized protein LOC115734555 n=1 Tax=Rhodamnia argentea TaxID=178133 RepID=A0ABM3HL76_9MYRT|nr:uncharacterized protein LOC115734555 [Rhodamnia argentea]